MTLRLEQLLRLCRNAFALFLQCQSATSPRQAGGICLAVLGGDA